MNNAMMKRLQMNRLAALATAVMLTVSASQSLAAENVDCSQKKNQSAKACAAYDSFKNAVASQKLMESTFVQTIYDSDGFEIDKYSGDFLLDPKRPGFAMDTTSPDAAQLRFDGQTISYYDEALMQVSLYDTSSLDAKSPFWLLLGTHPEIYASYEIAEKSKGVFTVKPKVTGRSDAAEYTISFDDSGIASLNVLSKSGTVQNYVFGSRKFPKKSDDSRFEYVKTEGVTVDDQRGANGSR